MNKKLKCFVSCLVSVIASVAAHADGMYQGSWIGLSGEVTIPATYSEAPVTAAEIADFANVTKIIFENADTVVAANGLTEEVVLNAELSGPGTFSATGCSKVSINSNNKAFVGKFAFNNTLVSVAKRYGLGSAADGDGKCTVTTEAPTSGSSRMRIVFTGTGDDLRLENGIVATRELELSAESTDEPLVVAADISETVASKTITFGNKVKLIAGTVSDTATGTAHLYLKCMDELWIGKDVSLVSPKGLYFNFDSSMSKIHLGTSKISVGSTINPQLSTGTVICEADDIFINAGSGFSPYVQNNPNGYLDLNGTTQSMRKMANVAAATHKDAYFRIHSDRAATLKLCPNSSGNITDGAPANFTGRVNVDFSASASASSKTNSFKAATLNADKVRVSTSKGTFTVESGIFAFDSGWGWSGDVVVSGGTLCCNSMQSLVTTNGTLTVSGAGKLFIGTGVKLAVAGATIGNATLERYRTYSVAEINALDIGSTTIDGEGCVYVGAPSVLDEWTGWPKGGGEARVPNDMTVLVTDADVNDVSALSSILLGRGAQVVCVNTNEELVVNADVLGAGVFGSDGAKSVTISGDVSDVGAYGKLLFRETPVVVSGSAKLTISSSAMFSGECTLSLKGEASLEIDEGVEALVFGGTFGTAELENNRLYTTSELDALSEANAVTGAGTLAVAMKHIPGKWTGWPDVGTTKHVEVPDNEIALISDGDVGKVEALSSIVLGTGARIEVRTTGTAPLNLGAALSGVGLIVVDNAAPLVLSGDNSRLVDPAAFVVTSTAVTVTHRYGLGGPRTGAASFNNTVGGNNIDNINRERNILLFGNGFEAVTNEVPIHYGRSWIIGSACADYPFVQCADFIRHYAANNQDYLWFTNDVTMVRGTFGVLSGNLMSSCMPSHAKLSFEEGARLDFGANGSFYVLGYQDLDFGQSEFVAGSFYAGTVCNFNCTRTNVFEGLKTFVPYTSKTPAASWDLNGFDQRLCRLGCQSSGDGKYYELKSSGPAVLTVSNWVDAVAQETPVKFAGNLSVRFSGSDTYTIKTVVSTATGLLEVSAGSDVTFADGAAFNASPEIIISGGTLGVAADACADGAFSRQADMVILDGGKLVLNRNETVRTLKFNDDYVQPGTYGSSASSAKYKDDSRFSGTGVLQVRRPCPHPGLLLFVR